MTNFVKGQVLTADELNAAFGAKADATSLTNAVAALNAAISLKANAADLASTQTGKGAALVGFVPTGVGANPTTVQAALDLFNHLPTGQFYVDYGARVDRLADRVFAGGAVKNLGTNAASQPDWLTQYQLATGRSFGFIQTAQGAILTDDNPVSCNTLVTAAQTLHLAVGNAIGQISVGVNNNTSGSIYAYGQYVEAYRGSNAAGAAYGVEIDVVNFGASSPITPYAQNAYETVALQLAAGAELPSAGQADCSVAINIWNNHAKFDKGIVFGLDSISGCDGVTGTGIAIAFARGHRMQWYAAGGVPTAAIDCYVTTALQAGLLQFVDGAANFVNNAGNVLHQFAVVANAANYLQSMASISGGAALLNAQGSDSNIDLALNPKGSGKLRFNNASSFVANGSVATTMTAVGPTGANTTVRKWLSVKDDTGNQFYIPCY